jgi:hypothetical protein
VQSISALGVILDQPRTLAAAPKTTKGVGLKGLFQGSPLTAVGAFYKQAPQPRTTF